MLANLKRYWFDHLLHVGVSGVAMACAVAVDPVCAVVFVGALARQTMGYVEKRDTVSLDLAYVLGGAFVGMLAGVGVRLWTG